MTIQSQNIVYVESQVMDDVPEGGGAATGRVIPDCKINNVYPDISDLDRAYGRFALRKIFLAIRTLNTTLYGGAKTVITALPTDRAVSYALFTTRAPFDTRTDAANRVEAYLYKGPMWHGTLHENHIKGMRTINLIQRPDTALPPIGKTLCLVWHEGAPDAREQYVRVTEVSYVARTFTDAGREDDYIRWIVTLGLSDALRHDFEGHVVSRTDGYDYTRATRIRDTSVADAMRFYGAQPLRVAAQTGTLTAEVQSLCTRLVPSAQTETPLMARPMSYTVTPMIPSAAAAIVYHAALPYDSTRLTLPTGCAPHRTTTASGLSDNGQGQLLRGGGVVGSLHYPTGEMILHTGRFDTRETVTYLPAAAVAQQAHTRAAAVTAETRRLNWLETLIPPPAPGTLSISYMAQGNWITLQDNGLGGVGGADAAHGAGTVSYVTGDTRITLSALPDVGSSILYSWASPAHYRLASEDAAPSATQRLTLDHAPLARGSLTLQFTRDGKNITVTDQHGVLVGEGVSGQIDYLAGALQLDYQDLLPDAGASLRIHYQWLAPSTDDAPPLVVSLVQPFTSPFALAGPPQPATLLLELTVAGEWRDGINGKDRNRGSGQISIRDDGQGRLMSEPARLTSQRGVWVSIPAQRVGSVDYRTGTLTVNDAILTDAATWRQKNGHWDVQTVTLSPVPDTEVHCSYLPREGGVPTPAAQTLSVGEAPVRLHLLSTLASPLVPGSVSFTALNKTYVERGGTLYTDLDPVTGAGVACGTLNYLTGEVSLTHWSHPRINLKVTTALIRYGQWLTDTTVLRTAAAPLKPESLTLTATAANGATLTVTTEPDGRLSGPARGVANLEFGVARVEWGVMGPDPDNPEDTLWLPIEIDPSTVRYNAVAYSYLPLDADILGIDPVRLPADGRVPIYRKGDVALILHSADTAPQTVKTGTVIACGRQRLAWVRVIDATGQTVPSGYTLDRVSGTVRFTAADTIANPVIVRHTIADLRQITDVQINGTLSFARALTHDYPAGDTLVAACLIHGDRRARVSVTFDQQSWDGRWSDTIVGNPATANLNLIAHPIEITNEGAETERWVLRWTSSSTVELIGEHVGLVYSGPYNADIAPINPRTVRADNLGGTPYFRLPAAANGGGWQAGNIVRINTVGAIADIWMARAIQQSDEPLDDGADGCEIYTLGNINRAQS